MPVKAMVCKKCGKELLPDSKFCLHCGEPVTPEEKPAEQTVVSEKKRGKVKFWLIGAASVLFAAGVLIAIFFADIVAWAERVVLSPEMLMMKAFTSVAQDAGIGDIGSGFSLETPRCYTMGIYVDEDILEFLSATEEGDSAWITDLNFQIVAGKEGDLTRSKMSLLLEEESIVSLDVLQNPEKAWLGIPELNERYLEIDKENLNAGQMNDLTDKLPSGSEMVQMLRTYGTILVDSIHTVTKENATLKVDSIRQDVLQLTATIRTEDIRKALFQMAQALKEDETARGLLNDLAGEDIHTEAVNWLKTQAESVNLELQLIAYLDRYNKLTGMEVTDGGGRTLFYWAKTVSNGKYASRLTCGNLVLTGNGTCSGETRTGECILSAAGKTILTYQLKDFALNKNGFTGSLVFPIDGASSGAYVPGLAQLSLELSQKTVSGEEVLSLNLAVGEKALAGLTFREERMKDFSANIPASVVPVSDMEKVEKWIEGLDWESIPQRLIDAGVPVNALGNWPGE